MDLGAVAFCMLLSFSLGAGVASFCINQGHQLATNDYDNEEEETDGGV